MSKKLGAGCFGEVTGVSCWPGFGRRIFGNFLEPKASIVFSPPVR